MTTISPHSSTEFLFRVLDDDDGVPVNGDTPTPDDERPSFPLTATHLRRFLPSFTNMTKSPYSKPPGDNDGDPPTTTRDIGQPMEVETAKTSARPMTVTLPWKNPTEGASSTPKLASTSFKDALIQAKIRNKSFDHDIENLSNDFMDDPPNHQECQENLNPLT
ncbi:hypothetical protein U1Q18_028422, partial [Sarracenia purpurea var. burkii]